jgi:hypothetical protein
VTPGGQVQQFERHMKQIIVIGVVACPKVHAKKKLLILDTPEHVDSENIKLKIGSRPLLCQLFSKCDLNS